MDINPYNMNSKGFMDLFLDFMDRMKAQAGVSKDKEIAELLGLSATALSERKKRDSIPIKEVFALAKNRPNLDIDPDYIVSGIKKNIDTNNISERHLIECYRLMSERDKKVLGRVASSLSGVSDMTGEEITAKLAAAETATAKPI